MEKIKNKLIEIYKEKFNKCFWAYENLEEFIFLKYLVTILNMHLAKVIKYWSAPNGVLHTKYKAMLAIASNYSVAIENEILPFDAYSLVGKFEERMKSFIEVINSENREKNVIDSSKGYSKIDRNFTDDNEIIRIVVEKLKRKFEKVLKDMEFQEEFNSIYTNISEYFKMLEKEIFMLEVAG